MGGCAALLIGVYDLGWQDGFQGKPTQKVLYLYETEHRYKEGEYKGKRILKSEKFSQSLYDGIGRNGKPRGKPAALFLRIRGMKGTAPVKPYDPEQDVGLPVWMNLVESTDKEYIDIDSVMPCPPDKVLTRETPLDYIPEWIKEQIEKGKEGKPEDWTPEHEDQPTEAAPAIDPALVEVQKRRADLQDRYRKVKASGVFSDEELKAMDAQLAGYKGALTPVEFLIKGWEAKVKAELNPGGQADIF